MIDKKSDIPKNINESAQNLKPPQQVIAGKTGVLSKQDQANKTSINVVSPFTINLIEQNKKESPLTTVSHQLLESNQRLTDFTSSEVNNTSGYNNRVTSATTVDIGQLNHKTAKMLEIHSLSELLGVFGAQLVSEGQNLQAGLNSKEKLACIIQFWYHNRLYKINTESMAKSLSINNEVSNSPSVAKEIESRFIQLQNDHKTLHLAFMVASPLLHQDISDCYDGLPQTIQYFRDDIKEILGHIDKQGLALRYRRSALTPQLLQQSVQKEGCMGLHLSLMAFNNGNEIQIQVEDNFGVKSKVIGEEQLKKLIFPNQLKFIVLTGQNSNLAAQLFQKIGIDHIICQEKTLDNDIQARQEQRLSLIFFRSFYQLLLTSDFSICQIFTIAVQNVAEALGRRESKKFKMIKKGSGTQEGHQCSSSNSIAKQIIKGTLIDIDNASNSKTFTQPNPYQHAQCDYRAKDLADILMKLSQPHTSVLQLYGEPGIGKSIMLQYLLQQVHDRPNIYSTNKIVLLDCAGVKDAAQFLQSLANALLKVKVPGDPQKVLIQWVGRINEDGGNGKHLIVLDHMENIFQSNAESKKFTTFLNNIILMGSQIHFIISSILPLVAELTIQKSTFYLLEGFNGEQAVDFFFNRNPSLLDELTKNWEKLNELNENAIEQALEGKLDKKYLNLKTCNKRHQHSAQFCVVPYLAKHPLFEFYLSTGNPFLLNITSGLASKYSLGKIFKELPSFKDNPIRAILEWTIFDKLDIESTYLLIMISCSQQIGGLTQTEIFRLRELLANIDDQKCRDSLFSLFDLGLIYYEQNGGSGIKYIKATTSFLPQKFIPEGLLEDPSVLGYLLDSLVQARKHQSKQEPKPVQLSGGREVEQQSFNNSASLFATNNDSLSKSKKNLFQFKRREQPSNNSPLLSSRKTHQITSSFDKTIQDDSSSYMNSVRKKNLFGNKSARKEFHTIVQDRQEEEQEDENDRNLQYYTPSKNINDQYQNGNQGNSQYVVTSHQREIFFQSYSKGVATPQSPVRPAGGNSQSKFIKKSRKHILYLNSVLGSAKSQNTSPAPYRSTSGLVFQTNRSNNDFGSNDLLSFIKNYDMQRFTSNNDTNQTSQNVPEFNMVKDWGLRLICKNDNGANKYAENNERFQLRELAKTYQAIIQEIKKMKKVQLTLKKVTDVLHIVLTTEQQQSSFVKEEDDEEDNSSLYIETESAVSKASSSGIYMQNSVKLRNSDYQMLQQLHRALQSTSSGDQKNTRDVIAVLYQQQEMSSGPKSDSDLLMKANIGLLQVYSLMTSKTGESNNTIYKQCISILENTIKIFEQVICKFGVAMCSVLLSHPSLCQLKTVTIKGVSSVDYLKIQAIPLFKIAGFTLGEQAGNLILEKKVDNSEVSKYLLTIIKTNKTPSFIHNQTEDSPLKQFSQGATGVVVPSSVKLLRSRVNSNADGTGLTSQRASAMGGPRGSKFSML